MHSSRHDTGRFPFSRVLVTGGAGFIGSALVWALNQRGVEQIVVADRLGTDERWRNLAALRFEDYVDADEFLDGLPADTFGRFDLVLHMGACSATTERDASYLMRNNFEYTKRIARWAIERNIRFVYASSAATYGDGSAGMSDADESPRALAALRPLNAYGYSKHLFDLYAARAGMLSSIVGLKYFNVFGPNESHKGDMRSLVNKAYHQIVGDGCVRLFKSYRDEYADGEQQRDFLYVKDAVQMTLHLATDPSSAGLFNIGSGNANTWLSLAHALFRTLDRAPAIEFIEMPDVLRGKYQYYTRADISKLRRTGYRSSVLSFETAVEDYVRNYLVANRRLGDEIVEGPQ